MIKGIVGVMESLIPSARSQLTSKDLGLLKTLGLLEGLPLSLHDTRVFLLAFCRLGSQEKSASIATLFQKVEEGLQFIKANVSLISSSIEAGQDKEVATISSFFARLINLCINAYLMIRFDPLARLELFRVAGASITTESPSLYWHVTGQSEEKSFAGVFANCLDPKIPNHFLSATLKCEKHTEVLLNNTLNNALVIGIITAPTDQCHLVFAAWNALGKRELWTETPEGIIHANSESSIRAGSMEIILQLRDEISLVYNIILQKRKPLPDSALTLVLEAKKSESRNSITNRDDKHEIKQLLLAMITKGSILIEQLLDKYGAHEGPAVVQISSDTLCLLEALPAYISFAISCFTKPQVDLVSSLSTSIKEMTFHGRTRAYSSESENNTVSACSNDSRDSGIFEVLDRIQDACETLGAAPSHPDWLDIECCLHEGISFQEAAQAAESAVRVLTKLAAVSLNQVQILHKESISLSSISTMHDISTDGIEQLRRNLLAYDLWWFNELNVSSSSVDGDAYETGERDLNSDISTLCHVDKGVLCQMFSPRSERLQREMKEQWSTHTAQRVLGSFQDVFRNHDGNNLESAELRLGGEWEVLLSQALCSTSLHNQTKSRVDTSVAMADRWYFICLAGIESMVPSTALLRFGLSSGGRKKHPLSSVDSLPLFDDLNKALIDDADDLPKCVSTEVKTLVASSLSIISRLPPLRSIRAIASHLMVDGDTIRELQSLEASSTALRALSELADLHDSFPLESISVAPFLVERIVAALEYHQCIMKPNALGIIPVCVYHNVDVVSCLWPGGQPKMDTFVSENVDVMEAIKNSWTFTPSKSAEIDDFLNKRLMVKSKSQIMQLGLLFYIWEESRCTKRTRAFFLRAITSIGSQEFWYNARQSSASRSLICTSAIVDGINDVPDEKLKSLTFETLRIKENVDMQKGHCELLCLLLANIEGEGESGGEVTRFRKGGQVLDFLLSSEACQWFKQTPSDENQNLLNVRLLYACSQKIPGKIISILIKELQSASPNDSSDYFGIASNLSFTFDFLNVTKQVFSKRALPPVQHVGKQEIRIPVFCSFARKSDYQEQHWYNCYTCGLVADKGCCTLCALVCHRGHNVSYARYSSFFCDCGAYSPTPGESRRQIPCKCLTMRTNQQMEKIRGRYCSNAHEQSSSYIRSVVDLTSVDGCASIVKNAFPKIGKGVVSEIANVSRDEFWIRTLMSVTKRYSDDRKTRSEPFNALFHGNALNETYSSMRARMRSNKDYAQWPNVQNLTTSIHFLGSSKEGSLQMRMASDANSDRMQRIFLKTRGMSRCAIHSDHRGRIVVAETEKLTFFSILPMVNRQLECGNVHNKLGRSSLCPLGSIPIEFGVLGVRFMLDYDRFLVVWGEKLVKVIILKDDSFEKKCCVHVSLKPDEGSNDDTDRIVSVKWLDGAFGILLVASLHSLQLFDLSKSIDNDVQPLFTIKRSLSGYFRDFAVVLRTNIVAKKSARNTMCWSVFVSLRDGQLHVINISSHDGCFSVGDFKSSSLTMGVVIKLEDIATKVDGLAIDADTVKNPLKGSFGGALTFLQQSRILLLQTTTNSVVAHLVDQTGRIKTSFKFLASVTSVGDTHSKCCIAVTGPYTNWSELGIVLRGESTYFRVSCCGTKVDTNEQAFIYVIFNEKGVEVHSLNDCPESRINSDESIDGSSAFTFPLAVDDTDKINIHDRKPFVECLAVCFVTSAGTLQLYAETSNTESVPILARDLQRSKNCLNQTETKATEGILSGYFFPLLAFEQLKNISDLPSLFYQGEGLESAAIIREKLQVDPHRFLMSPRMENFTFTISSVPEKEWTIAGVRMQFGNRSLDSIPSAIYIQGRCRLLVPKVKKWYSFPMSTQEIALSIRSGFVTVEVGITHDGTTSAIVDAIEVYGAKKEVVEMWLPTVLRSVVATDPPRGKLAYENNGDPLKIFISMIGKLAGLVGSFDATKDEILFVKYLVQDTFLRQDSDLAASLVKLEGSIFKDEDSRQSFHDKAVLSGCSNFLRACYTMLNDEGNDVRELWQSLAPFLRTCLQIAAKIAKQRTYIYLQAADERPLAVGSIATDAGKVLVDYFTTLGSNADLVSDFVELSLVEAAVAIGSKSTSEYSPRGRFGSLDGLRELLASTNSLVVRNACSSISDFCHRYASPNLLTDDEVDLFIVQTMEVRYACDSCTKFIEDVRYTLSDDDHPFDLCTECYHFARNFSQQNTNGANCHVIVNGKAVGDDPKLTCGEVDSMRSVEIKKSVVTQIGRTLDRTKTQDQPESNLRQQLFGEFMGCLFAELCQLLECRFVADIPPMESLFLLAVDSLRHIPRTDHKIDQGKRLVKVLVIELTKNCARLQIDDEHISTVTVLLEALVSTIVIDVSAQKLLRGIEDERMGNIMNVEGENEKASAMSNDLADHGGDFFVLSLDEKIQVITSSIVTQSEVTCVKDNTGQNINSYTDAMSSFVWSLLRSMGDNFLSPLTLLRRSFELQVHQSFSSSESIKQDETSPTTKISQKECFVYEQLAFREGVFCSHGRLSDLSPGDIVGRIYQQSGAFPDSQVFGGPRLFVQKLLELLSLVAGAEADDRSIWFSILGKVIVRGAKSTGPESRRVQSLASRVLEKFCGKEENIAGLLCDYFAFEITMEELLLNCEKVLRSCVNLNEKVRLCNYSWRTSKKCEWESLLFSDLVGAIDLVSEDVSNSSVNEAAAITLNHLLSKARKSGQIWRRFCGVHSIDALANGTHTAIEEFRRSPPIKIFFALASALNSENQLKSLKLIQLALLHEKEEPSTVLDRVHANATEQKTYCLSDREDFCRLLQVASLSLKDILNPSVNDVVTLVQNFVCDGSSSEIRIVSCDIAMKLFDFLDHSSKGPVITRLLSLGTHGVGTNGKRYLQLLLLLGDMLTRVGASNLDVSATAKRVQVLFMRQLIALGHDRGNCNVWKVEPRSNASAPKKFDLVRCLYCRTKIINEKQNEKQLDEASNGKNMIAGTRSLSVSVRAVPRPKWLSEQVAPFSRGRLVAGRDGCTSNEFCTFFPLKRRFVISSVHLEVSDPRVRFVKKIKVYFSPRPVDTSNRLKSPDYASLWQLCGEINLERGATRSSCNMTINGRKTLITAANLKIEYLDFYERTSSSKNSDGSFVLQCPRCARVVTNAHGVCSNCGEVAFQCRKCRHINYDSLDSFLCVECGYCSSGTFSYEITAGAASNAIAITNDNDLEKLRSMASIAAQLLEEIRATLRGKLTGIVGTRENEHGLLNDDLFPRNISRAVTGSLPLEPGEGEGSYNLLKVAKSQLGKPGSVVKFIAQPDIDPSDQARSLFRIARQMRSESSTRRWTETFTVRHLGRALNDEESASEFLGGLLEGSGSLTRVPALDPSDPLSRLLASVESRRERREAENREETAASSKGRQTAGSTLSSVNAKDEVEECEKLYMMLNEAEQEFYDLCKKIRAWNRLEQGSLRNEDDEENDEHNGIPFEPSHCSNCACSIAWRFLELWLVLFEVEPSAVLVSHEFVNMLINEDSLSHMKSYQTAKRSTIKAIAIRSEEGSRLVLNCIRARLSAFHDVQSAEIVGDILQAQGISEAIQNEFAKLATDALSSYMF